MINDITEILFVVNFIIFCCICIPYEFLWIIRPRKGRIVTGIVNAFVYSIIFTVLIVYLWYIAVIIWLLLGFWLVSKVQSSGKKKFVASVVIAVAVLVAVIGIGNNNESKENSKQSSYENYEEGYADAYYDEDAYYDDTEEDDDYYGGDDSIEDEADTEDFDVSDDTAVEGDLNEDYEAVQAEYILPYSDSEYLEACEVEDLSSEELRIARNEIYARHERKFKDKQLQEDFDSCSWYEGTIEPDEFNDDTMLNEYERYNRDLIQSYENN